MKWFRKIFQAPPFSRLERLLMRLALAACIWHAVPPEIGLTTQPDPVGAARLADLTFFASKNSETVVMVLLPLLLFGYVWGFLRTLCLVGISAIFLGIYTLDSSQGADIHTTQILGLVLLVTTIHHLAAWDWKSLLGWRRGSERRERFVRRDFHFLQQTVIATYLVSGISKLSASGLGWISDARFFPLQIRKTERMDYYNHLEEGAAAGVSESGSWLAALPDWVERSLLVSPTLAMIFIGAGLLFELGSPLALINRGWNLAFGLLLVVFHLSISAAMNLTFTHNIQLLLILFVLPSVVAGLSRLLAFKAGVAASERTV